MTPFGETLPRQEKNISTFILNDIACLAKTFLMMSIKIMLIKQLNLPKLRSMAARGEGN